MHHWLYRTRSIDKVISASKWREFKSKERGRILVAHQIGESIFETGPNFLEAVIEVRESTLDKSAFYRVRDGQTIHCTRLWENRE